MELEYLIAVLVRKIHYLFSNKLQMFVVGTMYWSPGPDHSGILFWFPCLCYLYKFPTA